MGKLSNGLSGALTGKVGDMVYYVLNGENVARRIGKRTQPPSLAQLATRKKMAVVTAFIKCFTEFVNVGFVEVEGRSTNSAYNRAVSYNRINAVVGAYPDFEMDYSKVLLSKGSLPGASAAGVAVVSGGLDFSWTSALDLPYPRENDQVMLLAYFPVLGTAVYLLNAAVRSEGSALLPVPVDLLSDRMEVYLAFVSPDRKTVADSMYLGRLN